MAPAAAAVQPLSASVDSVDPHLFDDGANDQPMDEAEAEQIQGLFDKTKNLYVCNKCSFSTVRKGWISRYPFCLMSFELVITNLLQCFVPFQAFAPYLSKTLEINPLILGT